MEFANLRNSENKENQQGRFNKSQDNEKFGKKFHNSSAHVTETRSEKKDSNVICTFCDGNHFIAYCDKFLHATMAQRKEHVSSLNLCSNCLNKHLISECNSKRHCFMCGGQHHTKLHEEKMQSSGQDAVTS